MSILKKPTALGNGKKKKLKYELQMKYFALNEMPWVYTEVSKRVIFACNVTKDPARVLVPLKTNIGDATICDRGAVTLRGVLLLTSKPASLTKLVFSLQSKINGAF